MLDFAWWLDKVLTKWVQSGGSSFAHAQRSCVRLSNRVSTFDWGAREAGEHGGLSLQLQRVESEGSWSLDIKCQRELGRDLIPQLDPLFLYLPRRSGRAPFPFFFSVHHLRTVTPIPVPISQPLKGRTGSMMPKLQLSKNVNLKHYTLGL